MNDTISYHEVKVIQGRGTREKHLGFGLCGMPPPPGPLHQDFHAKENETATLFKSLLFWDFKNHS